MTQRVASQRLPSTGCRWLAILTLCLLGCDGNTIPLAVEVAVGETHSCLLNNGTVWCWGDGALGKLGYGNELSAGTSSDNSKIESVDVGGVVTDISSSYRHTCVVLETGDVACWGINGSGQLGHGVEILVGDDEVPASLGPVDVGAKVGTVSAGIAHTCVTTRSNGVRCWGSGQDGRLGYANEISVGNQVPTSSTGDVEVGGAVRRVSAGFNHTCALLKDGAVRCWGRGDEGQLGYGNRESIGDDEVPATAGDVEVGGEVEQISAGVSHTCALLKSGAVRCWGLGEQGQLGYGSRESIGDDEVPATAGDVDVGGEVEQISAGVSHTCALLKGGTVRCWGRGDDGQLGYGNRESIGDDEVPATAGDVEVGGEVEQISAGALHTCALLKGGTVRCWGRGDDGQLGHGNRESIGDDEVPATAGDVCTGPFGC